LSKIEAGKMTLDVGRFSLPDLLQQSLVIVRDKAQAQKLKLSVEVAPEIEELAFVEGDERKIRQVMFNLLSNAVKFTPDGGSITVRAVRAEDQNACVVSVQDTGIGIALEDQERILHAFEQADLSYARQHQGTGLGLPLSRRIVELHGGRLWLQSTQGQGSTFSFSLPLYSIAESIQPASLQDARVMLEEAA
jgi:signal transduction histidine kinase